MSPADSVYVGDCYDIDAEGARAAGFRGIWLDRRRMATPDHLPPVISALTGLEAFVN